MLGIAAGIVIQEGGDDKSGAPSRKLPHQEAEWKSWSSPHSKMPPLDSFRIYKPITGPSDLESFLALPIFPTLFYKYPP